MTNLVVSIDQVATLRTSLLKAIQEERSVLVVYGRGGRPGRERIVRPVRITDSDHLEGFQEAPERRSYSQHYRLDYIMECQIEETRYVNSEAVERSKFWIDNYERTQRLNAKVRLIESTAFVNLPSSIERMSDASFLWKYRPGMAAIRLHAPDERNMAAFAAKVNAAAIEDWGGRSWVVIDAMLKYRVDWPGWYRYAQHLTARIKEVFVVGEDLSSVDWESPLTSLDWPGSGYLDPFTVSSFQQSLAPLYRSLESVPPHIMLPYMHAVREARDQYSYSELLGGDFANPEMILELYAWGLADGSFDKILDTTSIDPMREALVHCGLPLPEKIRSREPHIKAMRSCPDLEIELAQCLWPHRRSIFLRAPPSLSWKEFHDLRRQVICMGKLMYEHLAGRTKGSLVAVGLLS